jgi:hypothetical protein
MFRLTASRREIIERDEGVRRGNGDGQQYRGDARHGWMGCVVSYGRLAGRQAGACFFFHRPKRQGGKMKARRLTFGENINKKYFYMEKIIK